MQARRFSFAARQFAKQNIKVAIHCLAVVRLERNFAVSKYHRALYAALPVRSTNLRVIASDARLICANAFAQHARFPNMFYCREKPLS